MRILRSVAAHLLLVGAYGCTWLVATLGKWVPRRPWRPTGRIIVTGAFHNPNWYLSHVVPLCHSGATEVIMVVDEPQLPLERVRFVCPPKWGRRLLGRVGARTVWLLLAGLHYRPDLYMGYHIIPAACSALAVGKLLGRPACYQMTGGPVEVIGGGFAAVESAGGLLERPSRFIEGMILAVTKIFDLVVVRGKKAQQFLVSRGIRNSVAIITGSVAEGVPSDAGRKIDLIFVGRLAPTKQVDQFITIVGLVAQRMPSVRAVIIGDGPLMGDMKARAGEAGLTANIEFLGQRADVPSFLADSRLFVLTSRSEGLSIAMAEAMVVGAVPVVADVGELGDLVSNGVNGYLIQPNCVDEYVERIMSLLQNQALWERCSRSAVETARTYCNVDAVSRKWRYHLREVIGQASGMPPTEVVA